VSDPVLLYQRLPEGYPADRTHPGAETRGCQEESEVLVKSTTLKIIYSRYRLSYYF